MANTQLHAGYWIQRSVNQKQVGYQIGAQTKTHFRCDWLWCCICARYLHPFRLFPFESFQCPAAPWYFSCPHQRRHFFSTLRVQNGSVTKSMKQLTDSRPKGSDGNILRFRFWCNFTQAVSCCADPSLNFIASFLQHLFPLKHPKMYQFWSCWTPNVFIVVIFFVVLLECSENENGTFYCIYFQTLQGLFDLCTSPCVRKRLNKILLPCHRYLAMQRKQRYLQLISY